ncbi:MAG: class I SAM-dependent methyltransferase [Gammaproteobacteria bacterium]|nr:class I SAM-dependent methyltransferase [Gammaproteobacteria bacterium]
MDRDNASMDTLNESRVLSCPACQYKTQHPEACDLGTIRGNTRRHINTQFRLWKCPQCLTIISIDPVNFHDIYSDYPLNKRKLDIFAQGTLGNLLRRLRRAGLKKTDSILDYGCGNGIFIDYLKQKGYSNVTGYDPYVPEFSQFPSTQIPFDFIVNNDTLEHCDDIHEMLQESLALLKVKGLLYLGTADSEPVEMADLEPHIMRLHQPFHRVILTEKGLHNLVANYDIDIEQSFRRSYHDTLRPFSNYRFLDELNKAVGHDLDRAMDPEDTNRAFLRNPRLWFFALFGFLLPSAYEPALIVRKRGPGTTQTTLSTKGI